MMLSRMKPDIRLCVENTKRNFSGNCSVSAAIVGNYPLSSDHLLLFKTLNRDIILCNTRWFIRPRSSIIKSYLFVNDCQNYYRRKTDKENMKVPIISITKERCFIAKFTSELKLKVSSLWFSCYTCMFEMICFITAFTYNSSFNWLSSKYCAITKRQWKMLSEHTSCE